METQPVEKTIQTRDGLTLGFLEKGQGPPVVLLHALMASAHFNWAMTGVVDALAAAGFRVLASDFRGHGRSDRPPDPEAYSLKLLIDDSVELIESQNLDRCHIVGYSLGALVATHIAVDRSVALDKVVLAGIGTATVTQLPQSPELDVMVEALQSDDPESITHPEVKMARQMVDELGSDPRAVASIYRALQSPHSVDLSAINAPVLVLNGEEDAPTSEIGNAIPDASTAAVAGNHVTAPYDPAFASSIVGFLKGDPIA